MYRFRDINEIGIESKLSIQTIIDGVNLDDTLNFFTTLNVSGRSNLTRTIETIELGGAGNNFDYLKIKDKYLKSSIDGRIIEIEFKLKNKCIGEHEEFRKNAEKLVFYLNKDQVKISFTDDSSYSFIGTCKEINIPKEDRNSLICTAYFEIVDPFKYTKEFEKEFASGEIFEDERIKNLYEPLILSKDLIVTKDCKKIVMTNLNMGSRLQLNGDYTTGQKIEIGEFEITSKGRNITDNLDLNADWEDFYVRIGDRFKFENCKVILRYMGRML